MWNSKSPFYIEPRLSADLIRWGWNFLRSATDGRERSSVIALRDLSLLSQLEYEMWIKEFGLSFGYERKGLLEIFQHEHSETHARAWVEKAKKIGLEETRLLSREELHAFEPGLRMNARGAIFSPSDAHCFPNQLIQNLVEHLKSVGVHFHENSEATDFESAGGRIEHVVAGGREYAADTVVLAAGSWSSFLTSRLGIRMPLVAGRGYSVTLENYPHSLGRPVVFLEGRVAITPLGPNRIRFGGTMEITSHRRPPRMKRVKGILDAVKKAFPDFDIPMPSPGNTWFGYRPLSADGLPYIGRTKKWENLVVATGHSMIGISLGAGTGKLVDEIVNGAPPSMALSPFRVERF